MVFSLISAIGENNEIGRKNDLLWNLPRDMKHFRNTTAGRPVIMGQKTFESLGKTVEGKQIGKPLPNRRNIVITRDPDFKATGIEIVYSIDDLIELCENTSSKDEEFFVIGGGEIYRQMIDKANKLYITRVHASFPDAEIFFPTIDSSWQEKSRVDFPADSENQYACSFIVYEKS